MRPARCGITPEGWPCIGLTALAALVFACLDWWPAALIFLALCWFSGEARQCVSIFMNLFNVHVNRAPVACTVQGILYLPGKFLNASFDKASTDNERCAYSLRDANGDLWSMVQIAGLVARRIVCRVEEGDTLDRGERYGMIRFGSRVDLYLPEGYVAAARVGETVLAGQSVLARPR